MLNCMQSTYILLKQEPKDKKLITGRKIIYFIQQHFY